MKYKSMAWYAEKLIEQDTLGDMSNVMCMVMLMHSYKVISHLQFKKFYQACEIGLGSYLAREVYQYTMERVSKFDEFERSM